MELRIVSLTVNHNAKVPSEYAKYVDSAVMRLSYLRSQWSFVVCDGIIEVHAKAPPEDVVREVMHAIYREKIYAETLPLRRELLTMLTKA